MMVKKARKTNPMFSTELWASFGEATKKAAGVFGNPAGHSYSFSWDGNFWLLKLWTV